MSQNRRSSNTIGIVDSNSSNSSNSSNVSSSRRNSSLITSGLSDVSSDLFFQTIEKGEMDKFQNHLKTKHFDEQVLGYGFILSGMKNQIQMMQTIWNLPIQQQNGFLQKKICDGPRFASLLPLKSCTYFEFTLHVCIQAISLSSVQYLLEKDLFIGIEVERSFDFLVKTAASNMQSNVGIYNPMLMVFLRKYPFLLNRLNRFEDLSIEKNRIEGIKTCLRFEYHTT
jgi:hypothetical protein